MSDIDPNKLKVVELRAELTQRGLDTKGNKSILVERLREALDQEAGGGLPANAEETDIELTNAETKDDTEEVQESQEDTSTETEQLTSEGNDIEMKEELKEESVINETQPIESTEDSTPTKDAAEPKGEKRKRTPQRSPSPYHRHSERYRRSSPSPRRSPIREPSPDPFDKSLVGLDFNHSDLNLVIEKSHYRAEPLSEGGFAYMYAGARATYGIITGKVAFQVKILKQVEVNLPSDEKERHAFRIGFSIPTSSLQLGEEDLSYGYTDSGKSCTKSIFNEYGANFGPNDVITAFLNMNDETKIEISFSKNGEHLGICHTLSKEELGDNALFPHVLTKNCSFDIYFGQEENPFGPLPEDYTDYIFLGNVPLDQRVAAPSFPDKKEECEMIMLCGLPASGKTTWALKHATENPKKYYNIIGVYSIVEKMKIDGESRKKLFSGRWETLIDKASLCLNKILDMASRRLRNYILDQTNTYASAQRRKMRPFEGFIKKAIAIMPSEEEYKKRCEKQKQEGAKDISDHAVMEMKANLHFPEEGQIFTSVTFVELDKTEAETLAKTYDEEGRNALRSHKRYRPYQDERGRRGGSGGYFDKRPRGGFRPNWRPNHSDRRGPSGYNYNGPRGFHNRDGRTSIPFRGRRGQSYGGNNYGGPNPWKPGHNWNQNQNWGGGYQSQQHGYYSGNQYYYK